MTNSEGRTARLGKTGLVAENKRLPAKILLWCFLLTAPLHASEPLNFAAPSELPGVTREMKTAGFWIARHPKPDQLIMKPAEIAKFNGRVRGSGLTEDVAELPEAYDGAKLKSEITSTVGELKGRKLYQKDLSPADERFYDTIFASLGLESIPERVPVRFGFITRTADERLLPTGLALNAQPGDVDFDELQNNGLEIGTVVAVLSSTQDGGWLFVHDPLASGWVEANRVALVTRGELLAYLKNKNRVIVTVPKADVYLDSKLTKHLAAVKMGARFFLKNTVGQTVEILLPTRLDDGNTQLLTGFIAREEVSIGYLPYTVRGVYRQAFKMLHEPYGWGDMYGEQDCSRLLQMVFATFGFDLPRNSASQARTGRSVAEFKPATPTDKKLVTILASSPGLTILQLRGHIMLYLGEVNGQPYAIHSIWAYHEKGPDGKERARLLNRVSITGLDLGKGSEKKSLLERIVSIREIVADKR
ncbi:MAG: SH3 domain-containing protein [Candidatus Methylumidiphilus sp.]